ncbi:MAG: VOC family protein [Gemmatimonadales bacterium]
MAEDVGISPPGYRLPDATRIGRIRLQVADIDRSIAYYQKVLGLDVRERSDGFASLVPTGGGDSILELKERKDARAVPRRGLLGLYHFAVLLPDRASLGQFVAHLSEIGVYAGMSDHLVSEAVYLTDPDGLGIEVYADRPRESWQAVNRQLTMASNPLDVQNLIASAGGTKWDGMPAGTKIGHVHFYVGDIGPAADFYHGGLGLAKIVWSYPGALFMSAGGYHHHVGVNTWAEGSPVATDDDARLIDWELILPDRTSAEGAGQSLESAGVDVTHADGFIEASDPWGIKLRIRSEA